MRGDMILWGKSEVLSEEMRFEPSREAQLSPANRRGKVTVPEPGRCESLQDEIKPKLTEQRKKHCLCRESWAPHILVNQFKNMSINESSCCGQCGMFYILYDVCCERLFCVSDAVQLEHICRKRFSTLLDSR